MAGLGGGGNFGGLGGIRAGLNRGGAADRVKRPMRRMLSVVSHALASARPGRVRSSGGTASRPARLRQLLRRSCASTSAECGRGTAITRCARRPAARPLASRPSAARSAIGTSPVVGLIRSSYSTCADVGHVDVHVDEDHFQVGHLAGRCRRPRGRGWWPRRQVRERPACRPDSSPRRASASPRPRGARRCRRRTRRALRARGWSRGRATADRSP